jgi:hypothetical protein
VVFSYDSVSWFPGGAQVAVAAANGPFWQPPLLRVHRERRRIEPQARWPLGNIWDAVWPPDGRLIAFSMASTATGGLFELYLMHPDDSGVRQLTSATNGLFALHPTWPPTTAGSCSSEGPANVNLTNIWSINVDGSQLYQVTHKSAGYESGQALAWLP